MNKYYRYVFVLSIVTFSIFNNSHSAFAADYSSHYIYNPTGNDSGSTILNLGGGNSISILNTNPASIFQRFNFIDTSCSLLNVYNCRFIFLGGTILAPDRAKFDIVGSSRQLIDFTGSSAWPVPDTLVPGADQSIARVLVSPNPDTFLPSTYTINYMAKPSFSGLTNFSNIVANEDAILDSINSDHALNLHIKQTYSNGVVSTPDFANLTAPATNCVKLSGNGTNKITLMRSVNGGPATIADFLFNASKFRNELLIEKPYSDNPTSYSFYADIKKNAASNPLMMVNSPPPAITDCDFVSSEYRYIVSPPIISGVSEIMGELVITGNGFSPNGENDIILINKLTGVPEYKIEPLIEYSNENGSGISDTRNLFFNTGPSYVTNMNGNPVQNLPSGPYYLKVRAHFSPWSNAIVFENNIAPPTNLIVTAEKKGRFKLTWTEGVPKGKTFASYLIEKKIDGVFRQFPLGMDFQTLNTFFKDNFPPSTSGTFRVRAAYYDSSGTFTPSEDTGNVLDGGNRSVYTNEATAITLPKTSAPILGAIASSDSNITLYWVNTDSVDVKKYTIADINNHVDFDANLSQVYDVDGLSPATEYCFSVMAVVNPNNFSDPSNIVCATTKTEPEIGTVNSSDPTSSVSGSNTVNLSTTDPNISSVDLNVNGTIVGTDTAAPWNVNFDSTRFPNGDAQVFFVVNRPSQPPVTTRPIPIVINNPGGGSDSPIVNLVAASTTVIFGHIVNLSWTISNAYSCSGLNMPAGNWSIGNSGSADTSTITSNKTFSLSCINSTGATTTASVYVTVRAMTLPDITITANPTSVFHGPGPNLQGTTLSWSVKTDAGDYTYQSQFGSSGTGNGQFDGPLGVATDSHGNVYVSDHRHHRVEKFNSSGAYVSQFGSYGSGNAQFNLPTDVAIDSSDNVYVVDMNNSLIKKFDSNGNYITKMGNSPLNSVLHNPNGIAVSPAGIVYVSDTGDGRIQQYDANSGAYIGKFGSGDTIDGSVMYYAGIALDSLNNIYAVDSGNNRIIKFNSSNTYISKFGTYGVANGQFNNPSRISIDKSTDTIFVTDTNNNRIQKFNTAGVYLGTQIVGSGALNLPNGINIDNTGNMHVADMANNRVLKYRLPGFTTCIDSGGWWGHYYSTSGLGRISGSVGISGSMNLTPLYPPNATYSLTCTTGAITNSESVVIPVTYRRSVTVTAGINGSVSPSSAIVNNNATTTFAIVASPGYTASIAGTCPIGQLNGSTYYTTGIINNDCMVDVTFISVVPKMSINLSASTTVPFGGSLPITWTTNNAIYCGRDTLPIVGGYDPGQKWTTDGAGTLPKYLNGSIVVGPFDDIRYEGTISRFMLSCANSLSGASSTVSINIGMKDAPPSATISAATTTIYSGQSTSLTWSSVNASACIASGSWSGAKTATGTISISPTATSSYVLTCIGGGKISVPVSTTIMVRNRTVDNVFVLPWTATNIATASSTLSYSLNWNAMGNMTQSWLPFIHIVKASDPNVSFGDGFNFTVPTTRWNGNVSTPHSFVIPPGTPLGEYKVMAGLYDGNSIRSSTLIQNSGFPLEIPNQNRYQVGTINIVDPSVIQTVNIVAQIDGRNIDISENGNCLVSLSTPQGSAQLGCVKRINSIDISNCSQITRSSSLAAVVFAFFKNLFRSHISQVANCTPIIKAIVAGDYTITWLSGHYPTSSSNFSSPSINPGITQTLAPGGSITFYLDFHRWSAGGMSAPIIPSSETPIYVPPTDNLDIPGGSGRDGAAP